MNEIFISIAFLGSIFLIRFIIKLSQHKFEDSFFREQQHSKGGRGSDFDTVSCVLGVGIFGLLAVFYFSKDRLGIIPAVGSGLFLGMGVGQICACLKK